MTDEELIAAIRRAREDAHSVGRFLGRDPNSPELAHLLPGHTSTFGASRRLLELLADLEARGLTLSFGGVRIITSPPPADELAVSHPAAAEVTRDRPFAPTHHSTGATLSL